MAVDPRLGYDPGAGPKPSAFGVTTVDQWIASLATSWHLQYTNGYDMNGPIFAATYWAGIGLPPLNPNDAGIALKDGVPDPQTYNSFVRLAGHLASNWDSLPPDVRAMLPSPVKPDGSPLDSGPGLSDDDKSRIWQTTENEREREWQGTQNAANRQNAIDIANIGAAASRDVANINAASAREVAGIRAAVDREAIASTERIAGLDRASREAIARMEEDGRNRRFDLQLGEDRRQFNAGMLVNLLEMGVELSRRPVDWIAHQFYMANLNIPVTALNLGTMAMQLGALPPSGPSSAGPMIGGPGALDGDTMLAEQVGAQAGLVSVQEAIQMNPGAVDSPVAALTAAQTVPQMAQEAGGFDQLERAVASARGRELPAAVANNPVVQQALEVARRVMTQPPAVPGQDGMRNERFDFDSPVDPNAEPGSLASMTPEQRHAAVGGRFVPPQIPGGDMVARTTDPVDPNAMAGSWASMTPDQRRSVFGGMIGTLPATAPAGAEPALGSAAHLPPEYVNFPGAGNAAPPPVPTASSTGGENRGVYTGASAESTATPLAAPFGGGSGAPAQGGALLDQIAQLLGVPVEQVQQLVPPHLLAGGYSAEVIANSPVMQAIRDQKALSFYRTADASGEKFGSIQAFGIPLGMRSGQDLNAGVFLQAPRSGQEQIQGAIEASGQYWPDAIEQSLRASPITNYESGAFGRRRF